MSWVERHSRTWDRTDKMSDNQRSDVGRTKSRFIRALAIIAVPAALLVCCLFFFASGRGASRAILRASTWPELQEACRQWQDRFRYEIRLAPLRLLRGRFYIKTRKPEGEVQRASLRELTDPPTRMRYLIWANKEDSQFRAYMDTEGKDAVKALPDGSLTCALEMFSWGDSRAAEAIRSFWRSYFRRRYSATKGKYTWARQNQEYNVFARGLAEIFLRDWGKYDADGKLIFILLLGDVLREGDLWRGIHVDVRRQMFAKAAAFLPDPGTQSVRPDYSPPLHLAVLLLLVHTRDPKFFPYYVDYIENCARNRSDRDAALYCLFDLRAPEELTVPFCCRALRNPAWRENLTRIIESAKYLRSPDIVPPLLRFVTYDNHKYWQRAVLSLAWWKDKAFKEAYAALPREKQFQIQLILYRHAYQSDKLLGAPFLAADAEYLAKTLNPAHLHDLPPYERTPIRQALLLARSRPYCDAGVVRTVVLLGQSIIDKGEAEKYGTTFVEAVLYLEKVSNQTFRPSGFELPTHGLPSLTEDQAEEIWHRVKAWWERSRDADSGLREDLDGVR